MVGFSAIPHQPSSSRLGPTPFHLITTSAAIRLGHVLRHPIITHRHHLGLVLHSSIKNIEPVSHVPGLKEVWCGRTLQLEGFNFLQWSYDAWVAKFSAGLYFFSGEGSRNNYGDGKRSQLDTSRKDSFNGRGLTNVLIAINVLAYLGRAYLTQIATKGKINSLIDQGQLWRLVSSSFLHAKIGHLMVNCYSLNSIGPTMEKISGSRRYMAVLYQLCNCK